MHLTQTIGLREFSRQMRRSAVAVAALAMALSVPTAPQARDLGERFSGATGGILRYPNDLQPESEGNLFGEAWLKAGLSLYKTAKTDTAIYTLANVVGDKVGYSYNNTAKIGIGLSHSIQFNDALNVTLSARYDWYKQRETDVRREGFRYAIDYYYYKRWEAGPDAQLFGLSKTATVFKSYGTLAYPGSLVEGDDNLVLTIGGELSVDYDLPDTKWILTPFADFDFAWDRDQNNYNHKIVTGIGTKMRYPLDKGELFAGIRYSSDYRWINDTHDTGPAVYFGWYKGF